MALGNLPRALALGWYERRLWRQKKWQIISVLQRKNSVLRLHGIKGHCILLP